MFETAKLANVVLPGASFFEKRGPFNNAGRPEKSFPRTEIRLVEREMLR